METSDKTLSSVLTEISKKHDIALSTLKFNASILKKHQLIEFYKINGKRKARISQLGLKILEILGRNGLEEKIILSENLNINTLSQEIKTELEKFLVKMNDFHLKSSKTCIDIILGILYHRILEGKKIEETNLILSKGHAAPALYIILKKFGMIGKEEIKSFGKIGSLYQTHPNKGIPLVKVSTGSLGQGLSIANGIALAMKMDKKEDYVYIVVGDGELDEGQIWEAAATASTYGLDNIIVTVDRNGTQLTGDTETIKKKEPLAMKWRSFGWEVISIEMHSAEEMITALNRAKEIRNWPKVIIAKHIGERHE